MHSDLIVRRELLSLKPLDSRFTNAKSRKAGTVVRLVSGSLSFVLVLSETVHGTKVNCFNH
jgi:hypothetical protein